MPTVARDGRTIHYVVEGAGPGVVLVPGLGSGARLFGTLPRRFARHGFTCAAVDPVGMPPSSPLADGRYDFAAAASDVLAVAAQLPGPTALVGTSLGGKVALLAAAEAGSATVHRLVLLCSSAYRTQRANRVYRMFELLSTSVDPTLLGDLVAPFLFGSTFHEQKAGVVDDIVRTMRAADQGRTLMQAQARALQQFDGADAARRCACATLCLAGAEDTLTPPAEVARTAAGIAGARYCAVEHAGHSLLLESSRAFDLTLEFLSAR